MFPNKSESTVPIRYLKLSSLWKVFQDSIRIIQLAIFIQESNITLNNIIKITKKIFKIKFKRLILVVKNVNMIYYNVGT